MIYETSLTRLWSSRCTDIKCFCHIRMPYAVILLIYSFDLNDLIKEYFTCFQNMSNSKLNCQSGHLRKVLFLRHMSLTTPQWSSCFFRRKWKGEERGFGKVVSLKSIVNDWRSNGWGCGEPSIRAPENEVRIKANVYLRALFAFETLNGLIPSQQYIVTRKAFFFPCRGE